VVSFGLVDKGGPRDFSQFWRNKKQQKSKSLHARTPFLRGRVATKPPPTAMDFKATQKKERKGIGTSIKSKQRESQLLKSGIRLRSADNT